MKGGGGVRCGIAQTEIYYLFQGMIAVEQSVGVTNFEEAERPSSQPVLWIRDILVRIRIRGSLPLNYGYGSGCGFGSGSCSFR
jgi:hypothetical protein